MLSAHFQSNPQVFSVMVRIFLKIFTPYFPDTYRLSPFLTCAKFQHNCAAYSNNARPLCPSDI